MANKSIVLRDLRLLIDGALVPGAESVAVINPATGETLVDAPMVSRAQLDQAVAAALDVPRIWGRDEALRRQSLSQAADIVSAHVAELATILCLEIGLPYKLAEMETGAAVAFLRYRASGKASIDTIADDEKQRIYVRRIPVGVTGAILPWNAPLLIAAEKLSTAVAAGNSVVMKPSPLAPLTVLRLGMLLRDVFPSGVFNTVPGGDQLGKALVAHPKVGMISFTGSIAAGQSIMAASSPGLKRLSLELGGNDAAIVLPDVDIRKVARRLFTGAFFRTGQICAAIKRLYVHESIMSELLAEMKTVAEGTVLGDPFDPATTMGPLANRPQFERVENLVSASLAAGGKAVAGGHALDRPGNFYAPTLVVGLSDKAPLVAEEQFGPALPVLSFAKVEDAIEAANGTVYGLGGSVWTSDVEQGIDIASQLRSGTAWVNQHGIVLPHIPFGGVNLSGLGRANGAVGLDSYSELQTISVSLPPKAPVS